VLYFVLGFYECLFGFVGFISVCLGFVLGSKALLQVIHLLLAEVVVRIRICECCEGIPWLDHELLCVPRLRLRRVFRFPPSSTPSSTILLFFSFGGFSIFSTFWNTGTVYLLIY